MVTGTLSDDDMPPLRSGTHLQILSVLATELKAQNLQAGETVNILDIGCGDGLLIQYLETALPKLFPGVAFALYGFDVSDHGVQADGYFDETVALLSGEVPDVAWQDRLALISENDPWPYEDAFFAATVSNQVLEHVRDHDMFFAETSRVTKSLGVGVHVFPSRHTVFEPHILVPLAHRTNDSQKTERRILRWSRMGRGRYPAHKAEFPAVTPESYAARHTDYLVRYTNFQFKAYFLAAAKRHELHATFCHTGLYIIEKLRRMRGKPARYHAPETPSIWQGLASLFGPYLTNVTLVLRKRRDYDNAPK